MQYSISVMAQSEVKTAIDWAQAEGWNPGLNDAAAFYAADNTGFLMGALEGEPIATISAVKYGSSFGFIGLYIVKEAFRGQGFGLKIWQQAMDSLSGRNIGLDGVIAQQENYKKSGFKLAYRNIRFAGSSRKSPTIDARITDINDLNYSDLELYDRDFFPEERSAFLQEWISPRNTQGLALVDGSKILGYGCIRPCICGFKIGPLNAETPDLALALFTALSRLVPNGSDIFLDVPEPNSAAVALAQAAGMSPVFETARMYTKATPGIALDKTFGVTTFELG